MERVHEGVSFVRECLIEAYAASPGPNLTRCSHWLVLLIPWVFLRAWANNILLGIFDSHSLFADMFAHPSLYLNGTAPLNITGAVQACVFELNESTSDTGSCTIAQGTDRDSFLWCVHIAFLSLTLPQLSQQVRRAPPKWASRSYCG